MNNIKKKLNTDSKKLFEIVNSIKSKNTKNTIYKDIYNIHNNNFVKNINKNIKKVIKNKYNYTIDKLNFNYNEYKHLLNFNFISDNIKNNINNKLKTVFIIKYKNINVTLVHKNKTINKKIKNIINNILNVISILQKCFKNNNIINIILFFSELKKKFPTKNNIISPVNCNSGLTFYPRDSKNGHIVIFRKEEYCKVLFHECIHAFLGDEYLWDEINNKKIFDKYCLNLFEYNKININETYTEFLASIFNQLFIINTLKLNIKLINKLFEYESIYSLLKVKQILNHYNYNNPTDIYRKKKCKIFNQKTSVLSYYIFKTALYFNPIETLNFYNKKTNNMKIKKEYLETFIQLIIKSNDHLLLHTINKLNINNIKSKSLRMTLFEL